MPWVVTTRKIPRLLHCEYPGVASLKVHLPMGHFDTVTKEKKTTYTFAGYSSEKYNFNIHVANKTLENVSCLKNFRMRLSRVTWWLLLLMCCCSGCLGLVHSRRHSPRAPWTGYEFHTYPHPDRKPAEPRDIMVDVVNSLGLKLLAIQNENNEDNIAISPYGALSILVALGEGLQGEAVRELQKAACIPNDVAIIRVGLRDIHRHLKSYFIPKEGFLAGLTLNHDNVTLRPEYEEMLKFYGFDIMSFNNALYPDPPTTEYPVKATEATAREMTMEMTLPTFMTTYKEIKTDNTLPASTTTIIEEYTTQEPTAITSTRLPETTAKSTVATTSTMQYTTTNIVVTTENANTPTTTTEKPETSEYVNKESTTSEYSENTSIDEESSSQREVSSTIATIKDPIDDTTITKTIITISEPPEIVVESETDAPETITVFVKTESEVPITDTVNTGNNRFISTTQKNIPETSAAILMLTNNAMAETPITEVYTTSITETVTTTTKIPSTTILKTTENAMAKTPITEVPVLPTTISSTTILMPTENAVAETPTTEASTTTTELIPSQNTMTEKPITETITTTTKIPSTTILMPTENAVAETPTTEASTTITELISTQNTMTEKPITETITTTTKISSTTILMPTENAMAETLTTEAPTTTTELIPSQNTMTEKPITETFTTTKKIPSTTILMPTENAMAETLTTEAPTTTTELIPSQNTMTEKPITETFTTTKKIPSTTILMPTENAMAETLTTEAPTTTTELIPSQNTMTEKPITETFTTTTKISSTTILMPTENAMAETLTTEAPTTTTELIPSQNTMTEKPITETFTTTTKIPSTTILMPTENAIAETLTTEAPTTTTELIPSQNTMTEKPIMETITTTKNFLTTTIIIPTENAVAETPTTETITTTTISETSTREVTSTENTFTLEELTTLLSFPYPDVSTSEIESSTEPVTENEISTDDGTASIVKRKARLQNNRVQLNTFKNKPRSTFKSSFNDDIATIRINRGTKFESKLKKRSNSRKSRSVVDYVIARYYDNYNNPHQYYNLAPYLPQTQPSFLIQGKYREYQVEFMKYDTVLPFFYASYLKALVLSFPLDSPQYYLLLLLPIDENGVDKLICELRLNDSFKYILQNLRYQHVTAVIPSFLLKGYVNLTPTLQKLGVRRVFEPHQADFTPMTSFKDLFITNIEQAITVKIRNYVDPDILNNRRDFRQEEPLEFRADHPFIYFVVDAELQVALMAGKIVNPLNTRIS